MSQTPVYRARNFLIGISLQRGKVPSFAEYPFSIPAIGKLNELEFEQPVTFFIGENGSGKSTLLEAIAVACGLNPEGGSRNFRFSTRASHSGLRDYLRLSRSPRRIRDSYFLRAESYFNVATQIEALDEEALGGAKIIASYGGRSLHEQSHGESFFALFMNRLGGEGLYLLDEPEAALSPQRQLSVLTLIHRLIYHQSQLVIATHSPILLAYPNARIYHFSESGISRINYTETEHYQITKDFLNRHERMLDLLLSAEDEDLESKRRKP